MLKLRAIFDLRVMVAMITCLAVIAFCLVYTFSLKQKRYRELDQVRGAAKTISELAEYIRANDVRLQPRQAVESILFARLAEANIDSVLSYVTGVGPGLAAGTLAENILQRPAETALLVMNSGSSGRPVDGTYRDRDELDRPTQFSRADMGLWPSLDSVLRDIHSDPGLKWAYETELRPLHERLHELTLESAQVWVRIRSGENVPPAVRSIMVGERYRLFTQLCATLADISVRDEVDVLLEVAYTSPMRSSEVARHIEDSYHEAFERRGDEWVDARVVKELSRLDPLNSDQAAALLSQYCSELEEHVAVGSASRLSPLTASCMLQVAVLRQPAEDVISEVLSVAKWWDVLRRHFGTAAPREEGRGASLGDWAVLCVYLLLISVALGFCIKVALIYAFWMEERGEADRFMKSTEGDLLSGVGKFMNEARPVRSGAAPFRLVHYTDQMRTSIGQANLKDVHESLLAVYEMRVVQMKRRARESFVWLIRLGIIGTLIGIGEAFREMIQAFNTADVGVHFRGLLARSVSGNAVAVLTSLAAHVSALILEYLLDHHLMRKIEPLEAIHCVHQRLAKHAGGESGGAEFGALTMQAERLTQFVDALSRVLPTDGEGEGGSGAITQRLLEKLGALEEALDSECKALNEARASFERLRRATDEVGDAMAGGSEHGGQRRAAWLSTLITKHGRGEAEGDLKVAVERLRESVLELRGTLDALATSLPDEQRRTQLKGDIESAMEQVGQLVNSCSEALGALRTGLNRDSGGSREPQ